MVSTLNHQAVGFLDWDYCYKLMATQIPHDAGLVPILYIDQNSFCPLEIDNLLTGDILQKKKGGGKRRDLPYCSF